jgi:hypothetical protein
VGRVHILFGPDGEVMEYELRPSERENYLRGWKAMMLAPCLEIYEALLSGESVPVDRLDPEWVSRFGRRGR